MTIEHTSRNGMKYYLHKGVGKTGKGNYYFSTKPDQRLLATTIPSGFEIYENVGGQVFLRRKTPEIIKGEEVALVRTALNRHAEEWLYKIELKKNATIIYETCEPDTDLRHRELPWISKDRLREFAIRSAYYMAIMRFVLTDPKQRLFRTERFCFRGSIDDWIDIGGPAKSLETMVKKFVKHLGKDSFFELF